mmetsp:Transcript_25687/g.22800  ORF Transcript_25687/g.22800 Transcript_25687/m.22800 type:complete len:215 (+) Transcript_25687:21-665(+)
MDESIKTNKTIQDKICTYCFDNLREIHSKGEILSYPKDLPDDKLPIFVTWQLNGVLRGCIGTFTSEVCSKIVPLYSYIAAFKDNRFSPIAPKEVSSLTCTVSFLTDFEDIDDPLDFEVGKHGMEVEFKIDGKEYRSTYLPHVPYEQNWNQEFTLDKLIKKAGYKDGKFVDIKDSFVKATRYQSVKFKLSYEDYKQIKEDAGETIEEFKPEENKE